MRELPREPQSHAFLIKALREAAGELLEELDAIRPRDAHRAPPGEWSFAQIAAHVHASETIAVRNILAIVQQRRGSARLTPEPLGEAPEGDEARTIDLERAIYGYASLRQRLIHELYMLDDPDWQRAGEHPYRGPLTLLQIARELHMHDLEHLWQVRAHKQELFGLVR